MITQKPNTKGYPVWIILRDSGKNDKTKTFIRSHIEHWDPVKKVITTDHPDYDVKILELLRLKSKIKKINTGKYSYKKASTKLFKKQPLKDLNNIKSKRFVDLVSALYDGGKTTALYVSAVNSFNAVYPDISTIDIRQRHVRNYMNIILKHQKPNGVHTYLRTLDAVFKMVSDKPSPFKGIRPKKTIAPKKGFDDSELSGILYSRTFVYSKFDKKSTYKTINRYRYYWLLLFYLGGIDLIDLANLRYDRHVFKGRLQFYRFKGGTNSFIDNIIPKQASVILDEFDCYPYLVPIHRYNYDSFRNRMNKRLSERLKDLSLSRALLTKSARHTFINRAKKLYIDSRITEEIVGHHNPNTHAIYTERFSSEIRDQAHKKIIDVPFIENWLKK